MTQEQKDLKDLLLKDLCARLPYGVKISVNDKVETVQGINILDTVVEYDSWLSSDIEEVKPYIFPLSNMTEEQYKEWGDLAGEPLDEILTRNAKGEIMSTLEHHLLVAKSSTEPVNYCYKNHFDINGLIPKGLANDATNLNIY